MPPKRKTEEEKRETQRRRKAKFLENPENRDKKRAQDRLRKATVRRQNQEREAREREARALAMLDPLAPLADPEAYEQLQLEFAVLSLSNPDVHLPGPAPDLTPEQITETGLIEDPPQGPLLTAIVPQEAIHGLYLSISVANPFQTRVTTMTTTTTTTMKMEMVNPAV